MQFQSYDLRILNGGETIEVALGYAANVKVMDSVNYQSYRTGKAHQFFGGYFEWSPALIPVPYAGQWYVAIDLGGLLRAGVVDRARYSIAVATLLLC